MRSITQASFLLFFISFQVFVIFSSEAADTISLGEAVSFPYELNSSNGDYGLGLMDPSNTDIYYIGIFFMRVAYLEYTRVWVANREVPFRNFSSELKLLDDGNLGIVENSATIWSTNSTSNGAQNSTEAVLLNDGNFVLRSVVAPFDVLWQSFDYPTDTLLPGARIGYARRTNKSKVLTSWKNPGDPAKGTFSLEIDPIGDRLLLKNGTRTHWSSGPWNGQAFAQATELNDFLFFRYVKNENETYLTYRAFNGSNLYRFVMEFSGRFTLFSFDDEDWRSLWSQPRQECDVYAYCGAFSVCNQSQTPKCQCISGYKPRDMRNWESGNFLGGCARNASLQCGDNDEFLLMSHSKLLGSQRYFGVANGNECRLACLNNCSCNAYAYIRNCSIWTGELLSLQQLSNVDGIDGIDVYIRLPGSEQQNSGGNAKRSKTWIIVGPVAAVLVLALAISCIMLKMCSNWKGKVDTKRKEDLELPLFDWDTIATATKHFAFSNKIGQGGFGPVYKGVLPTGDEIAVKRLSNESTQGLEEFMNEVVLIIKLQHRNLVRLLGCCVHGEEKMLIYEYMSNGSLDCFIFDKTRRVDLNWKKRFDIIVGIARGLLYLHRDSRLRIVHRDLKASNVLLDNEMNPKISDFGTARAFRGEQTEENTARVVGTYGYMSPEYATDGLFSTKSDVFSFGVLLLEILSGRKNRGFHDDNHDLNLLGHAWILFNDNKGLELLDESVKPPYSVYEVCRCIQVGLLCVQKFPDDRPTMASVVTMLDTNDAILSGPKQPGFYIERSPFSVESPSTHDTVCSGNEASITLMMGR